MKGTIMFIHGARAYAPIVTALQQLGSSYEVYAPAMPQDFSYKQWRDCFIQERPHKGNLILVGHSFGAAFLLKYLATERIDFTVMGLFLLAPPYWSEQDSEWANEAYRLSEADLKQLSIIRPIYLYHHRDDEIVPFSHYLEYKNRIPAIMGRAMDRGGHFFTRGLTDMIKDIEDVGGNL